MTHLDLYIIVFTLIYFAHSVQSNIRLLAGVWVGWGGGAAKLKERGAGKSTCNKKRILVLVFHL